MRLLYTAFICLISISIFAQEDCINPDDIVVETYMYAYSPSDVSIDLGQTITWINTGGTHDVNGVTNSMTGEPFDNPESFSIPTNSGSPDDIGCIGSYTFTVPGVYSYDCSIYGHALQGMVGTITVGEPGCNDITACNYSPDAGFNDGSCVFVGDSCDDGDPNTLDDMIQENCECIGTSDPTWKCFNGDCYELDDGTGDFTSLAECEAECEEIIYDPTWKCFAGECFELDDGTGEYTSLADCEAECIILPSWDCVFGECVNPEDGSGFYLVLSDCESECKMSSITEHDQGHRKLIKISNLLGQKTSIQNNTTLLFIYNDGSVEKKFIIE